MTSGTSVASGSTSAKPLADRVRELCLIRRVVADVLSSKLDLDVGILGAQDGRDLLAHVLLAQARRDAAVDDDLGDRRDHVVGRREAWI